MLLGLSVVLLAAKIGGDLMVRMRQPAVLGELLVGVVLGNLVLLGFDGLEFMRPSAPHAASPGLVSTTLDMLARIGVILLLFEVGMESSVREMVKVGWSALLVAVLGVIAPMGLGWATGRWLLPEESWHVHLFLGATLCATSVGITARVLKDMGKSQTAVAKIVLGAAVIDDVLGLVVLAVVFLFFRYTKLGLAMRAAALYPESSRLLGVRTSWMLALGWGLSASVGAVSGMMVAPIVFLDPNMMSGILLYAFAAALVGGIDSPGGAVLGGFLVGILENIVGAYLIGTELKLTVALVLIVGVLVVRPAGLFGKVIVTRV